jgi:hypothetical protein
MEKGVAPDSPRLVEPPPLLDHDVCHAGTALQTPPMNPADEFKKRFKKNFLGYALDSCGYNI